MWLIVIFFIILLVILFNSRFEIRKEININAPKEKVWKAIIEFDRYYQWNSQLSFLGGEVKPNGYLHLRLAASGSKPYQFKAVISHWDEYKTFAWLAVTGMRGIFDGEHFFELTEQGNYTHVVNREVYKGLLSLLIKNLPMMKDAPAGFDKMNLELKYFVEKK